MESFDYLVDSSRPQVRAEHSIARAEFELKASIRATAAAYLAIHDTLSAARDFPEIFVPDAGARDKDAAEFAVRGAVLDLAVRMSIAENTVRSHDHTVATLLGRAPRVWALFREGEMSVANVRVVTDTVGTLPAESWPAFEDAAVASSALAPARFAARMRSAREKLQPDATERHRAALDERRVWLERDLDGMSSFSAYGPAAECEQALAHVDRLAREQATAEGETRTLAQLRADVALGLLAGKLGSGPGVGITVALTIPILTMLGHSDEPAILQGYGPIDAQTARELAGEASGFLRILTHPITGAIIDVDNPGYRPTAAQDRAVRMRDQLCTVPGCGRPAVGCDLDHTVPWPAGATQFSNLKALCRNHHRVKHKTRWKSEQDAAGHTTWTSPTGYIRNADPPPF